MDKDLPDHYAALGLGRRCTDAQIRAAYRALARLHHPDRNAGSADAVPRTQSLNAAYETLSDPRLRQAYDRALAAAEKAAAPVRAGRIERNISADVFLRAEEFLAGASLTVRVNDPASARGEETCELTVPPGTAPGARFRLPRDAPFENGVVIVRVRARPDARFKVRGPDLRCDLRISPRRAAQGGAESVRGLGGGCLRVEIPRGAARGEVICIPGEGLPKPRGGRGDLLVRIAYRPEVRITRRP